MTKPKTVTYEAVLMEHTPTQIADELVMGMKIHFETCYSIPEGITEGVPGHIYDDYRKGRDSACVDMVICTKTSHGAWKVLMTKRGITKCFADTWWIQGGATTSYCKMIEFIANIAEKECGVPVRPEARLGVYRTMSPEIIGSTTQTCFMARVAYQDVARKMRTDPDHTKVRFFSLAELDILPEAEKHWYPYRVAKLAIAACRIAG